MCGDVADGCVPRASVMTGDNPGMYVQRVEPSSLGGRVLAEAYVGIVQDFAAGRAAEQY